MYFFPFTSNLLDFSIKKASSKYFKYKDIVLFVILLFPLLTNVLYSLVGLVREPILEDIISIKVFNSSSFRISFLSTTSLIYTLSFW